MLAKGRTATEEPMHGTIDFWERKQWMYRPQKPVPPLMYAALGAALFAGALLGMRFIARTHARSLQETPRALIPSPARRRAKTDRWTAY